MASLLEGIRVIDCASFIAGPAAATIMADFGADVIKVEPPGTGDTYRALIRAPGNPSCEFNYAWVLDNRTKRGLTLDLKQPEGRDILYQLVDDADVFVTNTPLPARSRLGIRYEDIRNRNPRVIYASLTAYGEHGPEADNPGFDSTALWARSSVMDMARSAPDAEPVRSLPGMGDHPTAVSLYAAIMSGLFRRERTGEGAEVHTSLMANGVWWNGIQVQAMLSGAKFERRPARADATSALHNLYQTADHRWFHLVLIPEEKRWGPFLDAIERRDLGADPRFATRADRVSNARVLIGALDQVFASKDWEHWRRALGERGITYGLVGTLSDIPTDEQMLAADVLTPMYDLGGGAQYVVNSPLWVEEAPKVPPRRAPDLGEHTQEILNRLGIDQDRQAALREKGIID